VGGYRDVVLRELVKQGRLAGPDILATGVYVTPDLGESVLADVNLAPLMDGVESLEDLRALVRINHEHGVDWIKARTTERSGLVDNDPRAQVYTEEQIRAVVDEATKLGMPVMIHAHGESGVRAAVLGGARSVEHATYASDETLRLFKARGTYLVPTLGSITSFGQPGDYADPAHLLRGLHMAPRRIEMVQRAYAMGIPIVTGADTGYGPESAARRARPGSRGAWTGWSSWAWSPST
jgi:imidazolonepropionase-like amidohydrolase